jgi:hypothetical protein
MTIQSGGPILFGVNSENQSERASSLSPNPTANFAGFEGRQRAFLISQLLWLLKYQLAFRGAGETRHVSALIQIAVLAPFTGELRCALQLYAVSVHFSGQKCMNMLLSIISIASEPILTFGVLLLLLILFIPILFQKINLPGIVGLAACRHNCSGLKVSVWSKLPV